MRFSFKYAALAAVCLTTMPTYATNGSFMPGFGVKSLGMGGVGIAMQEDALSQVANPANATETGMRGDLGMTFFNPERRAAFGTSTGLVNDNPSAAFGFNSGDDQSGNRLFLMPDMGFTMPLDSQISVGFAMAGLGGGGTVFKPNVMASPFFPNTSWPGAPLTAGDSAGIDLMQLIAPVTVAYKLNPQHSVGASLNLAAQRFKANGLWTMGWFGGSGISADRAHLTNQGYDYSFGAGLKLGWLGKFMDDRVSLGATWMSRTYMTEFDKYRGLFAEQGDLDFPENFGIGLSLKPTEKLTIAADVVKVLYSDVASMGNAGVGTGTANGGFLLVLGTLTLPGNPYRLGSDQGLGFGWEDMTVYKLGVSYDVNDDLTVRAGYNYARSPINREQLVLSSLAPATTQQHYSVGFTYQMKGELDWEISGVYMHVPRKELSGCDQGVVDCITYSMKQDLLGIGFGVKY